MSYLVAFVRVGEDGPTYPMNCERADISVGETVIVERPGEETRIDVGTVVRLEYLDLDCKDAVLCQAGEAVYSELDGGDYDVRDPNPGARRVFSADDLSDRLDGLGWNSGTTKADAHSKARWLPLNGSTAFVILRPLGLDLQIVDASCAFTINRRGEVSIPPGAGRRVRHHYYLSGINLNALALSFALAFESGDADLDRYFVPRGTALHQLTASQELAALHLAIADEGDEPVYLSDGVWLHPDGSLTER